MQNDVEALHKFTNLNKPVDFGARMVYNEKGVEVFNFGKHKGRTCEEVLKAEPSYYSWMQQGDFTLDTKRKLTKIWDRMHAQKEPVKPAPAAPQQATLSFEPEKPIDSDLLNQLKDKFGK